MNKDHPPSALNSAKNLHLLSQTFDSVSDMCRKVGINRQQMNKYLNRNTHPSAHTARRISAAVGLGPEALFAEPREFSRMLALRKQDGRTGAEGSEFIRGRAGSSTFPQEFLGTYWCYTRLPPIKDVVMRARICLYETPNGIGTRFFERVTAGFPPLRPSIRRNRGTASWMSNKVFIHETPVGRPSGPALMVILPDYETRPTTFHGIQLYNMTSGSRLPYATRVTLRRIDEDLTPIQVVRKCGVFRIGDPELDEDIPLAVRNPIESDDNVLLPYLSLS